MKLPLETILAALMLCGCRGGPATPASSSASAPLSSQPRIKDVPGGMELINTPVATALDVYRGLTGKVLVVSPQVQTNNARVTIPARHRLTRADAARLLETSLQEQAGITIAPLDENRVSVTDSGK